MSVKVADLAGPGIGDYAELEKVLPNDYHSTLTRKETQQALHAVKQYIETNLCAALNLIMVSVPLIVESDSGVNDYLDRDGSRTPIQFHIANDYNQASGRSGSGASRHKMETDGAGAIRHAAG
jgi:aspartate--ammonia ligase